MERGIREFSRVTRLPVIGVSETGSAKTGSAIDPEDPKLTN